MEKFFEEQAKKTAASHNKSDAFVLSKDQLGGHPIRTKTQLLVRANEIREEMKEFVQRESKWSGKLRVVMRMEVVNGRKALGAKRKSCDISLMRESQDWIIWHEMLHSASVSYYKKQGHVLYGKIEEASVQLLTREICRKKGIPVGNAYEDLVEVLDLLGPYIGYKSQLEFAVDLFNVPLSRRLAWLMGEFNDKMEQDNLDEESVRDGIIYANRLSGAVNVKSR